jgi:hypothetical protein
MTASCCGSYGYGRSMELPSSGAESATDNVDIVLVTHPYALT